MLRVLLDENFDHRILRGLLLRLPSLDFVIAQETAMQGVTDLALLEWAARDGRVLLTHDLKTIPKYAYERVDAGIPMSGVFAVPRSLPIGVAVEQLELLIAASLEGEWENRVQHLPLQ